MAMQLKEIGTLLCAQPPMCIPLCAVSPCGILRAGQLKVKIEIEIESPLLPNYVFCTVRLIVQRSQLTKRCTQFISLWHWVSWLEMCAVEFVKNAI